MLLPWATKLGVQILREAASTDDKLLR